jgi:hypothetical protein
VYISLRCDPCTRFKIGQGILPRLSSQTWKTFLKNHMCNTFAADFFTVPTARFPPQSPWQNPYVERLIGSIRRDCIRCQLLCPVRVNYLGRFFSQPALHALVHNALNPGGLGAGPHIKSGKIPFCHNCRQPAKIIVTRRKGDREKGTDLFFI